MRVVMLHEFGAPAVLVPADIADPELGAGEVRVDVAFASITFVETQVRAGTPPNPAMLPALPAVLGNGVAGVVTAVGDGVRDDLVGARVVTSTGGTGGYAERVVVPAAGLIPVPDGLALDDAAALLADGRTAIALTCAAELRAGETVLVEAAAGGVGSLLVQLAKNAGCRVVGAAGSLDKLATARNLGADVVVNYRNADWAAQVRAATGPVDVVFDGVGGNIGRDAFALLCGSGRYCAFGMAGGSFANLPESDQPDVTRIRLPMPSPESTRELVVSALALAAEGGLRPLIGQRVPLARAADAHAAIEARETIGKTLLVP